MEIHKVKCDRCGKEANMKATSPYSFNQWNLPSHWKNVDVNWFVNKDICFECRKEIKGKVNDLFKQMKGGK